MSKRKRALRWLFTAAVVLVIAAAAWQFHFRPWREFHRNAGLICQAIEGYAADNEGAYPGRIEELISAGYLEKWPDNPFGRGAMLPQPPEFAPVCGRFVYISYNRQATYELVFYGPLILRDPYNNRMYNLLDANEKKDWMISHEWLRNEELKQAYLTAYSAHKAIAWRNVVLVVDSDDIQCT